MQAGVRVQVKQGLMGSDLEPGAWGWKGNSGVLGVGLEADSLKEVGG